MARLVHRLFGKADLTKILNDLVAICRASEEGFEKAASGVHDKSLRIRFMTFARERADFAAELTEELGRSGAKAGASRHQNSIQHSGWHELETRIRPKDDSSFLAECTAGEQDTLRHYDQALKKKLPPELQAKLQRQRLAVAKTLEQLRAVERVRAAT